MSDSSRSGVPDSQPKRKSVPAERYFTPLELSILRRLAEGKSNELLAAEFKIQEDLIKQHIRDIMRKLRAANAPHILPSLGVLAAKPEPTSLLTVLAKEPVPPTAARFLLDHLLLKADRDAISGDLTEEFSERAANSSPARARLWFWRQTVAAIGARNSVVRSLLVGGVVRLVEWIFRQIVS
jgi:DNA-binding CsgD family transcriptional regulator